MSRTRKQQSTHRYPRSARINEVLREVIATALERIEDDDPRLNLVTVTAVDTEDDIRHATVYFSALDTDASLEEVTAALEEHRVALQKEIGSSSSMKHTPQLRFAPDMGVIEGQRIDSVIRNLPPMISNDDETGSESNEQQSSSDAR